MGTSRSRCGRWWRVADTVTITPLRLAWLQALAEGPSTWDGLPKNRIGSRAPRGLVWGPLIAAGFITQSGAVFAITDTGRAVLAKALRVAANQGENDA